MYNSIVIYVLSDSIGETGEQVAKAAVSQFNPKRYEIRRFPYITDEEQISEVFEEAKDEKSIIIYTIVIERLRDYIIKMADKFNIPTIDLMTPTIDAIKYILGSEPKRESGLIRKLDEKYFRKVDAVEFAVKYDDGKDPRGIKKADVVILGVSRTSKTPLSMYLANKNLKVANIPLVPEVEPPKEIFEIPSKRIFGLTSSPNKLNVIRQERLKALGLSFEANYANMDRILQELEYAENIMKKIGCPIIDVTHKAIEETASIILRIMKEDNN